MSGPLVGTNVAPDPNQDLFTFQNINKDLNPVINRLKPSGNWRIGDLMSALSRLLRICHDPNVAAITIDSKLVVKITKL